MRLRKTAALLAACLALTCFTACGIDESDEAAAADYFPQPAFSGNENESGDSENVPEEPETEGVKLNSDELYSLVKMFFSDSCGDNWYLSSVPVLWNSDDPADIDLYRLFYNGFIGECDNLSDDEIAYISAQTGIAYGDIKEMSQVRLPTQLMDNVLREYYGIGLLDTNLIGLENCIYYSDADCYYILRSAPAKVNIGVYSAYEQQSGGFIIYYSCNEKNPSPMYVMQLEPNEYGSYTIISNRTVA